MSTLNLTEDQALRLRCLELATTVQGDPVANAHAFHAFITGADDKTVRERVLQILEDAGVR